MIKHPFTEQKITPNQLAKVVLLDAIDARACDPLMGFETEEGAMTDRERRAFIEAFRKQVARVEKFINL